MDNKVYLVIADIDFEQEVVGVYNNKDAAEEHSNFISQNSFIKEVELQNYFNVLKIWGM